MLYVLVQQLPRLLAVMAVVRGFWGGWNLSSFLAAAFPETRRTHGWVLYCDDVMVGSPNRCTLYHY